MDTGQDTPELSPLEAATQTALRTLIAECAPNLPAALQVGADQLKRKVIVCITAVPHADEVTVNMQLGVKETQVGRER